MLSTLALTIVIHVVNLAGAPDPVVREAQAEVVAMLDDIGVAVEWAREPATPARPGAILLTLLPNEAGALQHTARPVLGAATRTALGTRVAWVFYTRVVEESDR